MFDDVVAGVVSAETESMKVHKEATLISNSWSAHPCREIGGGESTFSALTAHCIQCVVLSCLD